MKRKYYRGKLTKYHKQLLVRKTLLLILTTTIVFGGYFSWAMYQPEYTQAEVNINVPQKDNRTIQDHVWDIMTNEFHLTLEEKVKAFDIITCESHWNVYAINKNRNGTYDLGLWQINDIHKLDRACSLDVYCSTRWAIEKYQRDGSWNAWVCSW